MAAGNRDHADGPVAAAAQGEQAASSSSHALSGLHPNPAVARHMMNKLVQRRAERKESEADAPEQLQRADGSGGAALPEKLQEKFGGSLGTDVSDVRVHTGSESAAAAKSVNARAYTVGKNVHFADGQYQPESEAGEELLAHEVAHTVQQSGAPRYKLEVSQPGDAAEEEADRAAAKMVKGAPAKVSPQAAAVSRKGPVDAETQAEADKVAAELEKVIPGASWDAWRPRLYDAASADNRKQAKERKKEKRPDLKGLGKITTLEDFAAQIKALQPKWGALQPNDRLIMIRKAADKELKANGIPEFMFEHETSDDVKGRFFRPLWEIQVGQKTLNLPKLDKATAADLCNTVAHEARHAEQAWLAARYAAGPEHKEAVQIKEEEGIPIEIANQAYAQPMNADTDAASMEMGKEMYGAMVENKVINGEIKDDLNKFTKELDTMRVSAQKSLQHLKDQPSAESIAEAKSQLETLKRQMQTIEKQYALYRDIPSEKDAHVVGDAAQEAFNGWK
jgi:hypothetical protein